MSDDSKDHEDDSKYLKSLEGKIERAHSRIDQLWKVVRQLRHDIGGPVVDEDDDGK